VARGTIHTDVILHFYPSRLLRHIPQTEVRNPTERPHKRNRVPLLTT
jgi:hypothetical protein